MRSLSVVAWTRVVVRSTQRRHERRRHAQGAARAHQAARETRRVRLPARRVVPRAPHRRAARRRGRARARGRGRAHAQQPVRQSQVDDGQLRHPHARAARRLQVRLLAQRRRRGLLPRVRGPHHGRRPRRRRVGVPPSATQSPRAPHAPRLELVRRHAGLPRAQVGRVWLERLRRRHALPPVLVRPHSVRHGHRGVMMDGQPGCRRGAPAPGGRPSEAPGMMSAMGAKGAGERFV
mmetsp:Transcript_8873/g.36641  ORF Transcript_8873/g.36641 Transcript_8873/m.36641 type:complete len:235 (+) Transcript_8873:2332-3036(+)